MPYEETMFYLLPLYSIDDFWIHYDCTIIVSLWLGKIHMGIKILSLNRPNKKKKWKIIFSQNNSSQRDSPSINLSHFDVRLFIQKKSCRMGR